MYKGRTTPALRLGSLLLALTLLFALAPSAFAAETANTVQLTKAEGTVSVVNASGKNLSLRERMRLYNGYLLDTAAKSYAWLALDTLRLAKVDAVSEVEVRKSGKALELLLGSGNIYFNISEPLKPDESLTIRTSTMAVGIRGTCGWVRSDGETAQLNLLEGTVTCSTADASGGQTQTVTVTAGQSLSVDASGRISTSDLKVPDIPGFVLVECVDDTPLCQSILDDSGLDLLGTTMSEAQGKLAAEEDEIAEALAAAQQAAAQLPDSVSQVSVEKPAAPLNVSDSDSDYGGSSSGGGGGGNYTPSVPDPAPAPTPTPAPGTSAELGEIKLIQESGSIKATWLSDTYTTCYYVLEDSAGNVVSERRYLSSSNVSDSDYVYYSFEHTNDGISLKTDSQLPKTFVTSDLFYILHPLETGSGTYSLVVYKDYSLKDELGRLSNCVRISVDGSPISYSVSFYTNGSSGKPSPYNHTITLSGQTAQSQRALIGWLRNGELYYSDQDRFYDSSCVAYGYDLKNGDVIDVRLLTKYELSGQTVSVSMTPSSQKTFTCCENHTPASAWMYDDYYHWHSCTVCGYPASDRVSHSYSGSTCSVCGAKKDQSSGSSSSGNLYFSQESGSAGCLTAYAYHNDRYDEDTYTVQLYDSSNPGTAFTITNLPQAEDTQIIIPKTGTFDKAKLSTGEELYMYQRLQTTFDQTAFPGSSVSASVKKTTDGFYQYTFTGLDFDQYSYYITDPVTNTSLPVNKATVISSKAAWSGKGMELRAMKCSSISGGYSLDISKPLTINVEGSSDTGPSLGAATGDFAVTFGNVRNGDLLFKITAPDDEYYYVCVYNPTQGWHGVSMTSGEERSLPLYFFPSGTYDTIYIFDLNTSPSKGEPLAELKLEKPLVFSDEEEDFPYPNAVIIPSTKSDGSLDAELRGVDFNSYPHFISADNAFRFITDEGEVFFIATKPSLPASVDLYTRWARDDGKQYIISSTKTAAIPVSSGTFS